jgi:hypothetical protein
LANHYFGATVPGSTLASRVTTGTSTTSKNVEVVVLDGVTGNNKVEVLKALEAIMDFIATSNAPA